MVNHLHDAQGSAGGFSDDKEQRTRRSEWCHRHRVNYPLIYCLVVNSMLIYTDTDDRDTSSDETQFLIGVLR